MKGLEKFVSVIVPTYKDIVALNLILKALETQTYKNFEVIIAQDDDSLDVKEYLEKNKLDLKIKRFSHEDDGNRKGIIINKALPSVFGEYLIFIDGDVIPFSTFVESHVCLSEKKTVLCGRRVNLGDKVSKDLRDGVKTPYELEKNYVKYFKYIKDDNVRHYEQGIRLNPSSILYKIVNKLNRNAHVLGSNFSCFREDMFFINGFDESVIGCSKDDVDLEWRFLDSGCKMKSCKYSANLFHLNHSRNDRVEEAKLAKVMMDENRKNGLFVCKNGIKKL